MTLFRIAVLFLVLLLPLPTYGQRYFNSPIRPSVSAPQCANWSDAIVRITTSRDGRSSSWGSGTIIARDKTRAAILTCRHVIESNVAKVVWKNGFSLTGRVAAISSRAEDLALVIIDTPHKLKILPVAPSYNGSVAGLCGYPHAGRQRNRGGMYRTTANGGIVYLFTGEAISGESGGSVFSTNGAIGVITAAGGGETVATSHPVIRRFLSRFPWTLKPVESYGRN